MPASFKGDSKQAAKVSVEDVSIPLESQGRGDIADFIREAGAEDGVDIEVTGEDNKRILRRIDMYLMPLMCVTYIIQYIDKSALNYAAVYGLQSDLGLHGNQYSNLTTLFYVGYLIAEYPLAYVAQRFHLRYVLSIVAFLWGWVMMAAALCENYRGIAAQRFFLGCLECIITPIFVLVTGMWYTRKEQPLRIGIWYSMNGVGQMCAGAISVGLGRIHHNNIPSWKWLFILFGGVTVLWSIVLFWFFPSSPMNSRWFSKQDAVRALLRVKANNTGVIDHKIKISQIVDAFNDVQTYMIFMIVLLVSITNGIANFKGLITKQLGYNNEESAAFSVSLGASQVFWMTLFSYLTTVWNNSRLWLSMIALIPTLVGLLLQLLLKKAQGKIKLLGLHFILSYVTTSSLALGLPAQNCAGYTKRTTVSALAFLAYSAGNMIGPQAFLPGQDPAFFTGIMTCIGCIGGICVLCPLLRFYYMWQNRQRDAAKAAGNVRETADFADETDRENPNFRYVL